MGENKNEFCQGGDQGPCLHPSAFIQGGKRVCGVCHEVLPDKVTPEPAWGKDNKLLVDIIDIRVTKIVKIFWEKVKEAMSSKEGLNQKGLADLSTVECRALETEVRGWANECVANLSGGDLPGCCRETIENIKNR